MSRFATTSLILVLAMTCLAAGGCNATGSTGAPVSAKARWIEARGGLCALSSPERHRVSSIVRRLAAGCGTAPGTIVVGMLDADALAAFSWPDASVFLTRGLVNVADDDELAAAIAHEMGHMLDDGHLGSGVASLKGESKERHAAGDAGDAEVRADRFGRGLLAASGYDPDAMRRLLVKVNGGNPSASPRIRRGFEHRIDRLARAALQSSPRGSAVSHPPADRVSPARP